MKEHPILFSAPMVRALLAGTKTQTRRVVKAPAWAMPDTLEIDATGAEACARASGCLADVPCPFGGAGDTLWVREAWALLRDPGAVETYDLYAPEDRPTPTNTFLGGCVPTPIYRADGERPDVRSATGLKMRWRSPIHMTRWASRITLEITGVRVERLQDITDADARAEGACIELPGALDDVLLSLPRDRFGLLWERINGERAPWRENPWVWVVTFRRVEGERPGSAGQ